MAWGKGIEPSIYSYCSIIVNGMVENTLEQDS